VTHIFLRVGRNMKKLSLILLILSILLYQSAFAGTLQDVQRDVISLRKSSGSGSVCTGSVTFDWPMTADFVNGDDISLSGGCSVGDSTVTLGSAASGEASPFDTGYALYIPGSYDTATFAITLNDIFNPAEGTISFDIYVSTWVDTARILGVEGQVNTDGLYITLQTSGELRLTYEGNNAGAVSVTTAAADLAVDTKYTVIVKWRLGATNPNLSITANSNTATSDVDLTDWTVAASTANFGTFGSGLTPALYIKNIRMYSTWQ